MTYSHNALDITPQMTGANAPSPCVVSASTEYNAAYAAWHAFDHTESGTIYLWDAGAGVTTGWLKFDFGSAVYAVGSYSMYARTGFQNYQPTAWTFQGSNDNSNWTTLDTRSGISWSAEETKTFSFTNTTKYRYYRIDVTASGSTELIICELEMFGSIFVPVINGLQKIPHDITKYRMNPVELVNIANRNRIGIVGTNKHNYIGA